MDKLTETTSNINSSSEISENEIDLGEIIAFVINNIGKLIIGAVIGGVIAFIGAQLLTPYKAEVVINNQGSLINVPYDKKDSLINYFTWRDYSKSFPNLVTEMLEKKVVKADAVDLYDSMRLPDFWKKNITPTYLASKNDTKEIAYIPKNIQDDLGNSISNIVVSLTNKNKDIVATNIVNTISFIRNAIAYLAINEMVAGIDGELTTKINNYEKKINEETIKLKFKNEMKNGLLLLLEKYPQNPSISNQQVIDPKDAGAKYLPIRTQIIAVSNEILNIEQNLKKLRADYNALDINNEFLQKVKKLPKNYQGVELADQYLQIVGEIRKNVSVGELGKIAAILSLQESLINIKTSVTKFLDVSSVFNITRKSPIMPSIIGAFAGLMIMALFLLFRIIWKNYLVRHKA